MKTILLGQSKGKREVNEDNFINVGLSSNAVVVPTDTITQTLDSYKEYLNEKDSSEKYRLIFTINPVCTNVLFNVITEVVYKEGSDDCKSLAGGAVNFNKTKDKEIFDYLHTIKGWGEESFVNIPLGIRHAILDTAFSHPELGHLEYHCGIDIFDNHMLRKRGFSVINKMSSAETSRDNFNTIKDHLRDADGKQITEKRVAISNGTLTSITVNRHVYQIDSVKTFTESLTEGLVEENGWKGFINPVSLNIPNVFFKVIEGGKEKEKAITVNKCMNDRNAGDFIDMYPDRSLYSFVPKYNKYRDRLEYNWDYLITYPAKEDSTNPLVYDNGINGLECVFLDISEEASNCFYAKGNDGIDNFIVHIKTKLKNTFYRGSFVNITFSFGNGQTTVTTDSLVKVEGVGYNGDDTQHIFSVNFSSIFSSIEDCASKNDIVINASNWVSRLENIKMRVRKNVKGCDCKYYMRIFKPLPNVKRQNVETNGQFSNSLNKLAFAENIYSDTITQIVFNDDIITSEVRDNKNRKISELYLTIIKRNKGHQKWYNGTYAGSDIEYSHCFSEVSAGVDLSPEWDKFNIHKLTKDSRATNAITIEDEEEHIYGVDIKSTDNEFAGDIVEFSPYTVEEVVLEPIYHRFNTAQRETTNSAYGTLYYSQFHRDDYDVSADDILSNELFEVEVNEPFEISGKKTNMNICDEGYYYQPHYKIKLKSFDKNVKQGRHIMLSFKEGCEPSWISGNTYEFTTNVPNYLKPEQTVIIDDTGTTKTIPASEVLLINPETGEEIEGTVIGADGFLGMHITFSASGFNDISAFNIFRPNPIMPDYAYELKDGTGRYFWREILPENKIMYGDELYNSMFTNGAHYFHTGINFYLKRQDPTGIYGLNGAKAKNGGEIIGNMDNVTGSAAGKQKDVSFAEYIEETEGDIC